MNFRPYALIEAFEGVFGCFASILLTLAGLKAPSAKNRLGGFKQHVGRCSEKPTYGTLAARQDRPRKDS